MARAVKRMTPGLVPAARAAAIQALEGIAAEHGPVITSYPAWHPFTGLPSLDGWVRGSDPRANGQLWEDVDHPVYFARALLSCPYSDGEGLFRSVELINVRLKEEGHLSWFLRAKRLDVPLYHATARPVLVSCNLGLDAEGYIDHRQAMRGFLWAAAHALAGSHRVEVAEPWDNVREFFLGAPCGTRSSLFVGERAGSTMKKILGELNKSGIYGDLMAAPNSPR